MIVAKSAGGDGAEAGELGEDKFDGVIAIFARIGKVSRNLAGIGELLIVRNRLAPSCLKFSLMICVNLRLLLPGVKRQSSAGHLWRRGLGLLAKSPLMLSRNVCGSSKARPLYSPINGFSA